MLQQQLFEQRMPKIRPFFFILVSDLFGKCRYNTGGMCSEMAVEMRHRLVYLTT